MSNRRFDITGKIFAVYMTLCLIIGVCFGMVMAGVTDLKPVYGVPGNAFSAEIDGENLFPEEPDPVQEGSFYYPGGTGELVSISLVGDILLASGVGTQIRKNGTDYPWLKVAPVLKETDLAVGNLETSISTRGAPVQDKQYTFRSSPHVLEGAREAGMDVLTLANNHTLDYGYTALQDTMEHLNRYQLAYAGAGSNIEEARRPVIVDKNGLKIGILAFSRVLPVATWAAGPNKPGLASGYSIQPMLECINTLSRSTDVTIVSIHWGKELADYPEPSQIILGRQLIDAGADIVMGHHPHVLQGIETYKGKIIAYSLGNFIFTSSSQRAREGVILQIKSDMSGIRSARIVPTFITNGQPAIPEENHWKQIIGRLNELSGEFGTIIKENGELSSYESWHNK